MEMPWCRCWKVQQKLTIGGVKHTVKAGETIIMPAEVPHALFAVEDFKMLLTVVLPYEAR